MTTVIYFFINNTTAALEIYSVAGDFTKIYDTNTLNTQTDNNNLLIT